MRPLWSWIAQCNAYRVIDDDRFVGSRRIFLSGVVSWVWWNLLIRKISFLNELYARMFLLCLFSRIGVDYFNRRILFPHGRSSNQIIILFSRISFWVFDRGEKVWAKLGSPYVYPWDRSLRILRFGRWIRLNLKKIYT